MTSVAGQPRRDARSILEDPAFPRLKSSIIARTGLAFYQDRDDSLATHIEHRLIATNSNSCSDYSQTLHQSPAEFRALVNRLTVGETYFFRYPPQFDALRTTVLPACLADNAAQKRLSIWSAGCSTGAEPYSISIELKRRFHTQLAGWDVSILASDIDDQAIERARQGVFTAWELRSISPNIRDACFEKQQKNWRLREPYKEGVTFEISNLLDDGGDDRKFDIIMCRNVLIYFDSDTTRHILKRLYRQLKEGGWLFVGHAEPHFDIVNTYAPVNTCNTTLYRRLNAALPPATTKQLSLWDQPDQPKTPDIEIPRLDSGPPTTTEWTPPDLPSDFELPDATPSPSNPSPANDPNDMVDDLIAKVRNEADRGNWLEAADQCEMALTRYPLTPALHCYRALIYEHTGHLDAAINALQSAIYLDPACVMAHYHLGRCRIENNDPVAGKRSLERVMTLLSGRDDSDILPEADDLTVGSLRDYAKIHLDIVNGHD